MVAGIREVSRDGQVGRPYKYQYTYGSRNRIRRKISPSLILAQDSHHERDTETTGTRRTAGSLGNESHTRS